MKNTNTNYRPVTFKCSCGNEMFIKSTYSKSDNLSVSICSNCHPAYTNKKRHVDESGRIERFKKKNKLI